MTSRDHPHHRAAVVLDRCVAVVLDRCVAVVLYRCVAVVLDRCVAVVQECFHTLTQRSARARMSHDTASAMSLIMPSGMAGA